jgi:dipeptidyl aminopeptidase/acylaminoacyl peptidase
MKTQRRQWASFLIGVYLCMVPGLGAEEKRVVKPEDLVDIRGVSDPQISPDGKRVAFVVSEPAERGKPEKPRDTNIWVVPADGSEPARPFAASPKGETSPRWSPDGRYLAFLSSP